MNIDTIIKGLIEEQYDYTLQDWRYDADTDELHLIVDTEAKKLKRSANQVTLAHMIATYSSKYEAIDLSLGFRPAEEPVLQIERTVYVYERRLNGA